MFDDGLSAFDGRSAEVGSLRRYLDTLGERRWFVLSAVVVCTLAAAAYALTAPKVYDAHADMLITPVPADQTAILGLGLLRQATDPTRDVTTASRLINNPKVAARVQRDLRVADSPQALLRQITVDPVADSSIVTITASTSSAARSQRLANAFATAAVEERTDQLHRALGPAISNMRRQIQTVTGRAKSSPENASTQPLYQQLAAMEALQSAPDPTIRLATPASLPTGPSAPRTKLDIAAGIVAGLLLGIAGAFALNAFDPRRAREGGLGATGLAVVARVPRLGRGGRARHAFDEAFRTLRTTLRFSSDETPISTVAVTSASEQEGKTTASFQLAVATLEAGQTVLLVEADPFRPGLWSLVESDRSRKNGEAQSPGLLEYLSGSAELDDVVQRTALPGLTFMHAGFRPPASMTGVLEGPRGRSLAADLAPRADLVILDCPPVGPRSDALLIASSADAVLLIVDLERSDERIVLDTVRRLRRTGAQLLGIVLNRDSSASAAYDYRAVEPTTPATLLRRAFSRG